MVWKLDRLGRSLIHLVETVQTLQGRGVGFRSLQESLDTNTSGGNFVFHFFAALAEFERDVMRERTRAGRATRCIVGFGVVWNRDWEVMQRVVDAAPPARRYFSDGFPIYAPDLCPAYVLRHSCGGTGQKRDVQRGGG